MALWLSIFSDGEIVRFDYQNYTLGKGIAYDLAPGAGQVLAVETVFDCEFPFFWLIKEAIESKWDLIISSTGVEGIYDAIIILCLLGDHRQDVHIQLCDMLSNEPIAVVLNKMPKEHWSTLCQSYLTDVLKSVHNVPHRNASSEYEVYHYVSVLM